MVSLTKIYTRGGDEGMTSLVGGQRLPKHHVRFQAIGAVDETNAAIGLARQYTKDEENAMLERIQHDLFDLGADLATPIEQDDKGKESLRMLASQVERLENEIDSMNATLSDLKSFVLPGGEPGAAYLHLARVMARRAERHMTELAEQNQINEAALRYINRLSDHLFVLSRQINDNGALDVLWKPGVNR